MSSNEPAASPASRGHETSHPRRWWILVAICASLLIIVVDNTVLSVALPAIAEDFDAGTAVLGAIVDAYVVVFAGLLVAGGVAADRYGRRRVLLVGLAVFALASAAAGLAASATGLVLARAAMGVGAALVMPATLAVLVHVFPRDEHPKAFAAWAGVAAVAMAAGPVLGGFLVAVWSWAGVFWINVPLAVGALVTVATLVPESSDPNAGRVDLLSAALATLGTSSLILAVLELGEGGSVGVIAAGTTIATLGLAWFALRQRRTHNPLVDFRLYRDRHFAGGSAAAALLTLGTGSALFVLTQHLQLVLGYPALIAGAALAPLAAGVVLGSSVGGIAPKHVEPRWCVVIGFLSVASGFITLAMLDRDSGYSPVVFGLALLGLGTGFSSPAVTSTVLGAVPRHRAGMGSALNDTHQQLGIAFGVAAIGGILATVYRAQLFASGGAPEADSSLALTLSRSQRVGDETLADLGREAFVNAQSVAMLIAAACALAGAVVATLTLSPSTSPADAPEETGEPPDSSVARQDLSR
jgi:MFS transporter, DHA2 family, multidrug resistance protein